MGSSGRVPIFYIHATKFGDYTKDIEYTTGKNNLSNPSDCISVISAVTPTCQAASPKYWIGDAC